MNGQVSAAGFPGRKAVALENKKRRMFWNVWNLGQHRRLWSVDLLLRVGCFELNYDLERCYLRWSLGDAIGQ